MLTKNTYNKIILVIILSLYSSCHLSTAVESKVSPPPPPIPLVTPHTYPVYRINTPKKNARAALLADIRSKNTKLRSTGYIGNLLGEDIEAQKKAEEERQAMLSESEDKRIEAVKAAAVERAQAAAAKAVADAQAKKAAADKQAAKSKAVLQEACRASGNSIPKPPPLPSVPQVSPSLFGPVSNPQEGHNATIDLNELKIKIGKMQNRISSGASIEERIAKNKSPNKNMESVTDPGRMSQKLNRIREGIHGTDSDSDSDSDSACIGDTKDIQADDKNVIKSNDDTSSINTVTQPQARTLQQQAMPSQNKPSIPPKPKGLSPQQPQPGPSGLQAGAPSSLNVSTNANNNSYKNAVNNSDRSGSESDSEDEGSKSKLKVSSKPTKKPSLFDDSDSEDKKEFFYTVEHLDIATNANHNEANDSCYNIDSEDEEEFFDAVEHLDIATNANHNEANNDSTVNNHTQAEDPKIPMNQTATTPPEPLTQQIIDQQNMQEVIKVQEKLQIAQAPIEAQAYTVQNITAIQSLIASNITNTRMNINQFDIRTSEDESKPVAAGSHTVCTHITPKSWDIWASGYMGNVKQNTVNAISVNSQTDFHGGSIGIDKIFANNSIFGLALSYGKSNTEYTSKTSTGAVANEKWASNYYQADIYAQHNFTNNLFLQLIDGIGTYGDGTTIGNMFDFSSQEFTFGYHGNATIGYSIFGGEDSNFIITPKLSAVYYHLNIPDSIIGIPNSSTFTTLDRVDGIAGLNIKIFSTSCCNIKIIPEITAAVKFRLYDNVNGINANNVRLPVATSVNPNNVSANVLATPEQLFTLGGALTVTNKNLSISLHGSLDFTGQYLAAIGGISVKLSF